MDKNIRNAKLNVGRDVLDKNILNPKISIRQDIANMADLKDVRLPKGATSLDITQSIKRAEDLNPILKNAMESVRANNPGDKALSFSLSIKF
ncbi:hypothetical protein ORD22_13595 [Sporosarcina sp. GW1-11]|uniref:hypothetical protein n=1 Tax=Sporosarcina sp. GW1-11 TaxID=2899126 RepID=UPI00294D534F|nr:hypothetical protein [Sporosarcina sp. GW1-11]MDV6379249.1 hypothetical protein [Sporosarcina sp. GW1-11]